MFSSFASFCKKQRASAGTHYRVGRYSFLRPYATERGGEVVVTARHSDQGRVAFLDEPAPLPPLDTIASRLAGNDHLRMLVALSLAAPFAGQAQGDGHSVVVVPGLLTSDGATAALRARLTAAGLDAHGWLQGRNYGPRPQTETRLAGQIEKLASDSGRKVSLVGVSLGGLYVRQIAKVVPSLVRSVITIGSPFASVPTGSKAWRLYEALNKSGAVQHHAGPLSEAPPVPTTAIYSRNDELCPWQACAEAHGPLSESIEVLGSHHGLAHHPAIIAAVIDRLAQREDGWRPFEQSSLSPAFPLSVEG